MQGEGQDHTAALIEAALDNTHKTLLSGKLDGLEQQAAEIGRLILQLGRIDDAARARRLHEKAQRNELCLAAAARGVRAAQRRIAEIRSAQSGATYDGSGRRLTLGPDDGLLARRV